jgi:hypothetical protein
MKIIGIASVSLLFLAFLYSCSNDKGLLPPVPVSAASAGNCDSVKYSQDIQPFFNQYCVSCHSTGNPDGDFTGYSAPMGPASQPGDIKKRVVTLKDMPPAGSAAPSEAEREKIKCWVDNGALNN